jgi:hypothetical protein
MRGIVGGLTVLAASALAAGASEAGPFDGTWQTTVSCAEAGGGRVLQVVRTRLTPEG